MGRCSTILDIGIAYGFYDIVLVREYGMDVAGVELEQNIPTYCGLCLETGIEIIPGCIGDAALPLPDESYNVVILAEVLEHLRISPLRALNEIHRILEPDGCLVLTTPNIASLHKIVSLVRGRNILEEFVDDDSRLNHVTDSWAHIREYTMAELEQLLLKGGFTIQEKRYIPVDRRRSDQKSIPVKIYHSITVISTRVLSRYGDILFVVARKKRGGAR
jgi:SAM-dependent methyltransferase